MNGIAQAYLKKPLALALERTKAHPADASRPPRQYRHGVADNTRQGTNDHKSDMTENHSGLSSDECAGSSTRKSPPAPKTPGSAALQRRADLLQPTSRVSTPAIAVSATGNHASPTNFAQLSATTGSTHSGSAHFYTSRTSGRGGSGSFHTTNDAREQEPALDLPPYRPFTWSNRTPDGIPPPNLYHSQYSGHSSAFSPSVAANKTGHSNQTSFRNGQFMTSSHNGHNQQTSIATSPYAYGQLSPMPAYSGNPQSVYTANSTLYGSGHYHGTPYSRGAPGSSSTDTGYLGSAGSSAELPPYRDMSSGTDVSRRKASGS